jgi:hypothetical protein
VCRLLCIIYNIFLPHLYYIFYIRILYIILTAFQALSKSRKKKSLSAQEGAHAAEDGAEEVVGADEARLGSSASTEAFILDDGQTYMLARALSQQLGPGALKNRTTRRITAPERDALVKQKLLPAGAGLVAVISAAEADLALSEVVSVRSVIILFISTKEAFINQLSRLSRLLLRSH